MIINYEAFLENSLVYIPVHDVNSPVGEAIIQDINNCIEVIEPKIMLQFGAQSFYDAILAGLGEDEPDERWEVLQEKLIKALKYFVFIEFDENRQTQATEGGEITLVAQNVKNATTFRKHTKLYNYGVINLKVVYDFLNDNTEEYPEWEDNGFEFEEQNIFQF